MSWFHQCTTFGDRYEMNDQGLGAAFAGIALENGDNW
jgi:hypothetical protein